jgi:hypothetical protein
MVRDFSAVYGHVLVLAVGGTDAELYTPLGVFGMCQK